MARLSSLDKPTARDVINNLLTIAKNDTIRMLSDLDKSYQFNGSVMRLAQNYTFSDSPINSTGVSMVVNSEKYSEMLSQKSVKYYTLSII